MSNLSDAEIQRIYKDLLRSLSPSSHHSNTPLVDTAKPMESSFYVRVCSNIIKYFESIGYTLRNPARTQFAGIKPLEFGIVLPREFRIANPDFPACKTEYIYKVFLIHTTGSVEKENIKPAKNELVVMEESKMIDPNIITFMVPLP